MESFGNILKIMEKYSKAVGTAVQSDPHVIALVWTAIMRVRNSLGCRLY